MFLKTIYSFLKRQEPVPGKRIIGPDRLDTEFKEIPFRLKSPTLSHKFIPDPREVFRAYGIPDKDAVKWARSKVIPVLARRWQDAGFNPDTAKDWVSRKFSPQRAKEWRQGGFTVPDAVKWSQLGHSPRSARELSEAGHTPRKGTHTDRWAFNGFGYKEARKWSDAGHTADSAREWSNAGFKPSDSKVIRDWHTLGASAAEARKATDRGASPIRYKLPTYKEAMPGREQSPRRGKQNTSDAKFMYRELIGKIFQGKIIRM